jgi:MFS family permease
MFHECTGGIPQLCVSLAGLPDSVAAMINPPPSKGLGTFKWLNLAQFLGALNDNLFKFFAIFLLINLWGEAADTRITPMIGALFALPFLLFVTLAGILADRWSKSVITIQMKQLEIVVMLVGTAGLWLQLPWLLFATCFLMSLQSALFSPAKYGLIPELVADDKIPVANGHIQAFTYIAVILGTILAPMISEATPGHTWIWGAVCMGIAVVGLAGLARHPAHSRRGRQPPGRSPSTPSAKSGAPCGPGAKTATSSWPCSPSASSCWSVRMCSSTSFPTVARRSG